MKTYKVTVCVVAYETYEVEAESPESAEDNILDGCVDLISQEVSEFDVIEIKEAQHDNIIRFSL